MASRSRPRPIVPEPGPAGENMQADRPTRGTARDLRDLVAVWALILTVLTILIIIGNVGVAVLVLVRPPSSW